MYYNRLGRTGISVSGLCFGSLALGPLQYGMSPDRGADIIIEAINKGINLIDTAEIYGTYAHIRAVLDRLKLQDRSDLKPFIITKSYAYSKTDAKSSVDKAIEEMGVDSVDVFMMHEQESRLTLRGHRDALDYYMRCREKGLVKFVGVSTHNCEVVEACAEMDEIDVIEAIVNKDGLGIGDGSIERMLSALQAAYEAGKGIIAIKTLGGGNLIRSFGDCMDFVLSLPYVHSIAIGMRSEEEVAVNTMVFEGRQPGADLLSSVASAERRIHVEYWCDGCGRCVARCGTGAMTLSAGKASVDHKKCVLCSYCASICPVFAIKVL